MKKRFLERFQAIKNYLGHLYEVLVHEFWMVNLVHVFLVINLIHAYHEEPTQENAFVLMATPIHFFIVYGFMYLIYITLFEDKSRKKK